MTNKGSRQLSGQIALVTGASSGIGRATAVELATHGAELALADRDEAGMVTTAALARNLGVKVSCFSVDFSDATAAQQLVSRVLSSVEQIKILVNCAGAMRRKPISETEIEDWNTVLQVNLTSPFLLLRDVSRSMVARGGGGRIVNVSSSSAYRARSVVASYGASKAGLDGLTRAAAGELAEHGINVNSVVPGITETARLGQGSLTAEQRTKIASEGHTANLFKRFAKPEEVASVIAFLCLPASAHVTAQVIHVSAGAVV